MDEPWGISGPQFLLIYGLALAVVLVVQLSWPSFARSRKRNAPATVEAPLRPDVYQLAYLAGGADRAVDTAIATLLEQELLRVSSKGKLSAIGKRPRNGLERAVHDAAQGGTATVAKMRTATVVQPEVNKIREDLERRGLVTVAGDGLDSFRAGVVAVYGVLLVIGIARAVNGAQLDRPIGGLIALLVVAGTLTLIAFSSRKARQTARPTDAGHAIVVQAKEEARAAQERPEEFAAASRGGGVLFAGAAGVVALGGIALYPDDEMSTALLSGGGSSWAGGGGSSGGSSCGGGSSCSSGSSCGGGGSSCGGGGGCGG
ncbi:TIGR04222 domain-containing membrane protein [Amycolatopsis sp. WGS_07]|uniref:TIGR04222 domain-containing membrane protein n=1 Tax=Amycolatopsis sp. WGS_07 TaxID=3076764 RepID=UPI003872AEF1